jgi:hypothetical protein
MPLSYAELEKFYEGLVARARRRGIACAITSGMACVAFGVAQATQDCDLLCAPEGAGKFLDLLEEARLRGHLPSYRSQHLVRVEHAERLLPVNPLRQHGLERLIDQARAQAVRFVPAGALKWLPDVRGCFIGLLE